jgi:hypothetical protein
VTHSVLVYRTPVMWQLAWWVPLEFAGATLIAIVSMRPFIGAIATPTVRLVAADTLGFVGAYALTSFVPSDLSNVTLAILLVAFFVRVLSERISPAFVLGCALLAVGGVACEGLLSKSGAFHYLHPDVFGSPRWLAGIYLHAGLLTGRLMKAFSKEAS